MVASNIIYILFILILLIIIFGTIHYLKKAHHVTDSKESDVRLLTSVAEEINKEEPPRKDAVL